MNKNSLQESSPEHIPVMVHEVLELLITDRDGIYLDGTVGLGGHATHILNTLSASGRLIGLDRDEKALAICNERLSHSCAFSCLHASYDLFPKILQSEKISVVNGILLDLGLSSFQLDSPSRGFAFKTDGDLDMRFDTSAGQTAANLIASTPEKALADILYNYGEERLSRRIARAIKKMDSMNTVADLNEAVRRSTPPNHRRKSLARVFQALRIAVNEELTRLQHFLNSFIDYLAPHGRIVVLSYHSLEDRMVKHSFKDLAKNKLVSIITKKPLPPTQKEQTENNRARSAKLRAAERI
ncbi:MAG: 16S rRNA (cytosine(1402)-N(4))-methyltransferase RsmH [Candidatus Marinimicrobia bacterium]|nr:16S rRNA (cytosine(1402)-N(4))-methyltransferase RsmH [Candidatus Neomarinimicrobiota bacterium]